MAPPRRILPVIIGSQFAGTSLWFAGNAVLADLQREWGLPAEALGYTTSAVQLGFILGTLAFAFFAVSDRVSPRIVFFVCSLAGAAANLGVYALASGVWSLAALRFLTGFFLAGIYPVGMKIASGWYRSDLGNALGFPSARSWSGPPSRTSSRASAARYRGRRCSSPSLPWLRLAAS
jgi:MFS family permease